MANNRTNTVGAFFGYGADNGVYSDADSAPNLNLVPGLAYNNMVTKKFVIGRNGVAGCDFNFAAAADHAIQSIDLGQVLPAKAYLVKVIAVCVETVVGVTDFLISAGLAAGVFNILPQISCDDNNEVVPSITDDTDALIPVWDTASHIYVDGDPTDNTWNLMTAGKWELYITYIQL